MTLTDTLHDSFLSSGEILPPADIARIIQEHEMWNGVEYDAATILSATREAGERFVDSMVQNEHDTEQEVKGGLYQGFPIEPIEQRVAKWEAMRPSTIRRSSIVSLISTRQILHKNAFDSSPRITEVQTIQTPDGLVEVDFWRNPNGSIHHVGEPRKI